MTPEIFRLFKAEVYAKVNIMTNVFISEDKIVVYKVRGVGSIS